MTWLKAERWIYHLHCQVGVSSTQLLILISYKLTFFACLKTSSIADRWFRSFFTMYFLYYIIKWTVEIFNCQGEKGEPGPESKSPQGVIKFGDTAANCTKRTAGTVRYKVPQNALLLCDGSNWLPVMTGGKGHMASTPGRHCRDVLRSGEIMFCRGLKADWA